MSAGAIGVGESRTMLAPPTPARPSRFAAFGFLGWLAGTVVWWALALAPLPAPPEWLDRARAVCFGSPPGGLPDTWGWMLLALGPFSLLAFLAAVWGRDLVAWVRRLSGTVAGALLLGAVALPPLLLAGWLAERSAAIERASAGPLALSAAEGERLPPAYPRGADPAPAIRLVDQRGARLDPAALAGRPTLVTFAYAHCRTVCPGLVNSVKGASERLGGRASTLIVTLDPWRDTPSALPGLAAAWQLDRPGVHLLSGAVDEVVAVQVAYGLGSVRDESTGEITHPGLVFVLDGEGRIAYRFLNPPASWLVDAVARLEREPA